MTVRLSHLAFLLGVIVLAVLVGGIAATWRIADREFRDVLEEDLEQQAELMAELLADQVAGIDDEIILELLADAFEDDDEETLWVTVYELTNGRILSNLPHDLPLDDEDDGRVVRQFAGFGWHGVQDAERDIVVQLLRRDDAYAEIREELLEDIVSPALIGGAAILLLLTLFVLMTLVPTARLARELEDRDADSLNPLESSARAYEIRVLKDAINELMRGIASIVERERQFANDVAHELRTPLTTMQLELGSESPDLPVVKAETERLIRLVEHLLILARLEQGQWRGRLDRVDATAAFARVIERFNERFQRRGLSLDSNLAPVSIPGDTALLDTLLTNLLENVLRHATGASGTQVTLAQDQQGVLLTVSDDGPGIDPNVLALMRNGFRRLDSRAGGFGLGLAICHRIVAAHRGHIDFGTPDDGTGGLIVTVRFPA